MHLEPDGFYHIYNRANPGKLLFYQPRNYDYFLQKVIKNIVPQLDIVAYCLMPNHFHFLVYTPITFLPQACTKAFQATLSGYSKGINKQEETYGNLFVQHTQAKALGWAEGMRYAFVCFQYIHQNPLRARLEKGLGEWPWSSFRAYRDELPLSWLKRQHAYDHLGIEPYDFEEQAQIAVSEKDQRKIFVK